MFSYLHSETSGHFLRLNGCQVAPRAPRRCRRTGRGETNPAARSWARCWRRSGTSCGTGVPPVEPVSRHRWRGKIRLSGAGGLVYAVTSLRPSSCPRRHAVSLTLVRRRSNHYWSRTPAPHAPCLAKASSMESWLPSPSAETIRQCEAGRWPACVGRTAGSRRICCREPAVGNIGGKSCLDDKRLTGAQYAVLRDAVAGAGRTGRVEVVGQSARGRPASTGWRRCRYREGVLCLSRPSSSSPNDISQPPARRWLAGWWPVGGQAQASTGGLDDTAWPVPSVKPGYRNKGRRKNESGHCVPAKGCARQSGEVGESCAATTHLGGLADESGAMLFGCLDVALRIVGEQGGESRFNGPPRQRGPGICATVAAAACGMRLSVVRFLVTTADACILGGAMLMCGTRSVAYRGSRSAASARLQAPASAAAAAGGAARWDGGVRQCGLFGPSRTRGTRLMLEVITRMRAPGRGGAARQRITDACRRFIASAAGVSSWTAKTGVDVVLWASLACRDISQSPCGRQYRISQNPVLGGGPVQIPPHHPRGRRPLSCKRPGAQRVPVPVPVPVFVLLLSLGLISISSQQHHLQGRHQQAAIRRRQPVPNRNRRRRVAALEQPPFPGCLGWLQTHDGSLQAPSCVLV